MRNLCLLGSAILLLGCSDQAVETSQNVVDADLTPVQRKADEDIVLDDSATTSSQTETGDPSAASSENPDGRTVVEDRSSSAAAKLSGEINFDDLKFPIEKDQAFKDEMLTDSVKQLQGREVKLRGFILPASVYQNEGIERFVLVRDNQECCFGPGAALFDCVMVEMTGGATADFVTRPVTVEGKFAIDTEKFKYPGGKGPRGASHLAIFEMEAKHVE